MRLKKLFTWRIWSDSILHQTSRTLVNSLDKENYVVMEKLDRISERVRLRKDYRVTFHGWTFRRLQNMIEYKGEGE